MQSTIEAENTTGIPKLPCIATFNKFIKLWHLQVLIKINCLMKYHANLCQ